MKRLARYLVLISILLPSVAGAVDVGVDSNTLIRFEERSYPGFPKKTVVPATEFLGADLDKLGDGNLSLHMYGWGRVDLDNRSTNEGYTDGDLTYAYLRYRLPRANGQIRAGRFFVNEGVAAEQIDGVSARADLCREFGLSLFAGAPVQLDSSSKSKGDYIYGGRMNLRLANMFEVGFSALQEGNVRVNQAGATRNREMLGGDVWFAPVRKVELTGHTFYNLTNKGFAENSYLLTFKPLNTLIFTGDYNYNRFKDYFTFTNVPQIFNPNLGGKLETYGLSAAWTIMKPLEVIGDYHHYKRDAPSANSDRYGAEVRYSMLENLLRTGLAYHLSKGGDSINSYNELHGYGTYRGKKYMGSLDGIVQFYDQAIYNKHYACQLTASAGYRLLTDLVVSGDISYASNPNYANNVSGMIKLTYNFNYTGKGAKQ